MRHTHKERKSGWYTGNFNKIDLKKLSETQPLTHILHLNDNTSYQEEHALLVTFP